MSLFAVVIFDISTNDYANEHSERDLTSCATLASTSDLLEIWINLNINGTNLNSFWNFMTGNKNVQLLCPMTAWYIVEMSKQS